MTALMVVTVALVIGGALMAVALYRGVADDDAFVDRLNRTEGDG